MVGMLIAASFTLVDTGRCTSNGGEGTADDPIMIYDVHDLQAISGNIDAHYALANDIDASETIHWNDGAGFMPIGDNNHPFTGCLDGRGYTISRLFIDRPDINYLGLFGYIGFFGSVDRIGLVNISIRGTGRYSGGLVGFNRNGRLSSSYVTGNIDSDLRVGGLVGWNEGGVISNSFFIGNVKGYGGVGGLVGWNERGTIYESYSESFVTGKSVVGGLVGHNREGSISKSYSVGDVMGLPEQGILRTGNVNEPTQSVIINVTVPGSFDLGGLVGENLGSVSDSYAKVNVSGNSSIGGLIGRQFYHEQSNVYGMVLNSYATGNVVGRTRVGGLMGENYDGRIIDTYATGIVIGESYVGGLLGRRYRGSITNSFWDVETSEQKNCAGGTGLTTAEMSEIYTFLIAGWDIVSVSDHNYRNTDYTWNIVSNETYPFLSWESILEVEEHSSDVYRWYISLIAAAAIAIVIILVYFKKKR